MLPCVYHSARHVCITPPLRILVNCLLKVAQVGKASWEIKILILKFWRGTVHTRIHRRLKEDQVSDSFQPVSLVEVCALCVQHEVLLVVVELVPSFGHAVLFAEWLRYWLKVTESDWGIIPQELAKSGRKFQLLPVFWDLAEVKVRGLEPVSNLDGGYWGQMWSTWWRSFQPWHIRGSWGQIWGCGPCCPHWTGAQSSQWSTWTAHLYSPPGSLLLPCEASASFLESRERLSPVPHKSRVTENSVQASWPCHRVGDSYLCCAVVAFV